MKRRNKKIVTLILVICFVVLNVCTGFNFAEKDNWIGSWNVGTTNFINMRYNGLFNYHNQTLRTVVTLSYGGSKERIKFSNEYGTEPLEIGAASVALINSDDTIQENTSTALKFNGNSEVSIEEGDYVWSDPINLDVKSMDKIAISTYLPNQLEGLTGGCGNVKSYVSGYGNYTMSENTEQDFEPITIGDYPNVDLFSTSVEVTAPETTHTILVFGDSISTFAWPEYLAKELNTNHINNLSVIREAIVGNRVLYDTVDSLHGLFGNAGVSRFETALTSHSGIKYVVALEGANDIISTGPGGTSPVSETVTAEQLIGGLRQYISLAHKHNVKIYGATILPFKGYVSYTEEEESVREQVNAWIRTSNQFDAVIDFEQAVKEPSDDKRLRPQYDLGDHLHPSDAGSEAMAKCIDLDLFK